MTDTPEHVQEIQLQLWLSKSPGERLLQFLTDNDALYKGILAAKKDMQEECKADVSTIASRSAPQVRPGKQSIQGKQYMPRKQPPSAKH